VFILLSCATVSDQTSLTYSKTGNDGQQVLLTNEDDVVDDETGSDTCPISPKSTMRRFDVPEETISISADVDVVFDV
jgi:hypothetical protein